jgi:hypothetical protein
MGNQARCYLATVGTPGALLTIAADRVRDGVRLTVFDSLGRLHTATLSESQVRAMAGCLDEMADALAGERVAA